MRGNRCVWREFEAYGSDLREEVITLFCSWYVLAVEGTTAGPPDILVELEGEVSNVSNECFCFDFVRGHGS
jgi:hypothetical protein